MKKLSKILAIMLACCFIIPMVACKKVKEGCVISTMQLTIDYYDINGQVVDTQKATIELYENNAPKTVAQIKKLVKSGYYNGQVITMVTPKSQGGFAQFGNLKYEEGNLVRADNDVKTVEGEFENNGFLGQVLSTGKGAVVLKRNFEKGGISYDTGKATLMVQLAGLVDISTADFCVVGKILENGESTVTFNEGDNVDEINRDKLSSFGLFNTLLQLEGDKQDKVTKTLYFNENDSRYCLKVETTIDATTTTDYYQSVDLEKVTNLDESVKLDADGISSFETQVPNAVKSSGFSAEFFNWSIVPFRKVIVRSAKIK